MAASVRIVINTAEVQQLLRGEGQYIGVKADLEERGKRIAQAAGGDPDYNVESFEGHDRIRVHVATATPEAMVANAQDHTLIRALDAGR